MYILDSYDITLVPVSHYMGGIQVGGTYCSGRSFSVKGVSITAKSHHMISLLYLCHTILWAVYRQEEPIAVVEISV